MTDRQTFVCPGNPISVLFEAVKKDDKIAGALVEDSIASPAKANSKLTKLPLNLI